MLGVILASLLLFISAAGLGYFASKKIPVLVTYPSREEGNSVKDHAKRLLTKVRGSKALHQVASPDILLQNVLSKTRIAAMKTESKTGQILENLRKKKSQDKSPKFSEDYWKKLRRKG